MAFNVFFVKSDSKGENKPDKKASLTVNPSGQPYILDNLNLGTSFLGEVRHVWI